MKKPLPFGKYLLLDRVAVGGMAEVFAAKTFGVEGFEKLVAIKRILPTMVEDDEFVAMFLDEARIAARLNHSTVAQVYELGKHEETYYIAMEYVSGRDVRLIIDKFRKRSEAVPLPLAAFIIAKVSEGLDYAHMRTDENGNPLNIIHRDISPQNILVSYDGEVKLIDFGIAKAAGRNQKTQVGILKGKFAYMSPEQVRGSDIDHRSDLYSVGVMLYEMITGVKLFSGESDFSTLEKVRAGTVRAPSELNPAIPAELEQVVLKALAKDRDERYQSGADICDDLMRYLYQAHSVFSSKSLARFMSETFVEEQRKESDRIRRWWLTTAEESNDFEAGKQKIRIGTADDVEEGIDGERTMVGVPGEGAPADGSTVDAGGSTVVLKNPTTPPPVQPSFVQPPPPARSGAGRALAIAAAIVIVVLAGGVGFVQLTVPGGLRGLFAPKPVAVIVTVTPHDGASIEIDGAPQPPPSSLGTLGAKVIPGTHHLRVSAAHYLTSERTFTVPGDNDIEVHLLPEPTPPPVPVAPVVAANPPPAAPPPPPPHGGRTEPIRHSDNGTRVAMAAPQPPPAPPPPPGPAVMVGGTASLTVDSDPEGALVKVDGHMKHTPFSMDGVTAGEPIPLVFVMRGYERRQLSVTLSPGENRALSERLVPAAGEESSSSSEAAPPPPPPPMQNVVSAGTLEVLCFPAAKVIVDGKETGYRTSSHYTKISLNTGHHSVCCESDEGQMSPTTEFDLSAGQSFQYKKRIQ